MRGLTLLACAALALGCVKPSHPTRGMTPPPPEKPENTEPAGTLHPLDVADRWIAPEANRAALAEQYFGKWWILAGDGKDIAGRSIEPEYLTFFAATRNGRVSVDLHFRDKRQLVGLSTRGPFKFKGKCKDETTFTDCEIVK